MYIIDTSKCFFTCTKTIDLLFPGQAFARYTSPQCASYARDKLHGFEYPIGSPLVVRCADEQQRPPDLRSLGQSSIGFDRYFDCNLKPFNINKFVIAYY